MDESYHNCSLSSEKQVFWAVESRADLSKPHVFTPRLIVISTEDNIMTTECGLRQKNRMLLVAFEKRPELGGGIFQP